MSDDVSSSMDDGGERLEAIQCLMDEILQIQKENGRSEEILERVQEIIQESSRIVEGSEAPHEMIVDAKILYTGTQVVSCNVSSLETNLTSFNQDEYGRGILTYLSENSNNMDQEMSWECLAAICYPLLRKATTITYMLGPFALEPPPKKERAKIDRNKNKTETEKKVLQTSDKGANEVKQEEDSDVYAHILKCLVRCYKKNNRNPISYFKFVLNPTSYWATVENIFHFSFLVRDNSIKMSVDSTGLPVVEPSLKSTSDKPANQRNQQFSLRLSVQEWQQLIQIFSISSPAITPFNKKR